MEAKIPNNKKININKSKCITCGICAQIYPDIFEFKNNKIQIINSEATLTKEIQDICPTSAIYSQTNPKN